MSLRHSVVLSPAARIGALLSLLVFAAVGIAFANTESVVAKRFAAALEQPAGTTVAEASGHLVSGSEAYWLAPKQRQDAADASLEPAAWAPLASGLTVGDRITIASGKSERILEVVAVSPVENVGRTANSAGHIAVTCRDLSTPNRQLVTFLIPEGSTLTVHKSARTS
jgi:hypothetical protein